MCVKCVFRSKSSYHLQAIKKYISEFFFFFSFYFGRNFNFCVYRMIEGVRHWTQRYQLHITWYIIWKKRKHNSSSCIISTHFTFFSEHLCIHEILLFSYPYAQYILLCVTYLFNIFSLLYKREWYSGLYINVLFWSFQIRANWKWYEENVFSVYYILSQIKRKIDIKMHTCSIEYIKNIV